MRRLDELDRGEGGEIAGFLGGDQRLVARLIEMGFDEGVQVTLTDRAPGGDPIAVRIGSTKVALRRALAARVAIR
ncbi:FeoA family protein [Thermaurantiacus sp.]